MERLRVNRTKDFKWNTRQELYDYCSVFFGLGKGRVDTEISDVLEMFSLRKGEAIKPQELWQKVGRMLESRFVGSNFGAQDVTGDGDDRKVPGDTEYIGWYEI